MTNKATWAVAALLLLTPQVTAACAGSMPSAPDLPSDVDGNARLVAGFGTLVTSLFLAAVALVTTWALLVAIFGSAGGRWRTFRRVALSSSAGLLFPLLVTSQSSPERPLSTFTLVWAATNLALLMATVSKVETDPGPAPTSTFSEPIDQPNPSSLTPPTFRELHRPYNKQR